MIQICDATPGTLHIRQVGGFRNCLSRSSSSNTTNSDSSLLVDDYELCCSSSTSSSSDDAKKRRHRRGISFSDIEVYEFPLVLGDNPCVSLTKCSTYDVHCCCCCRWAPGRRSQGCVQELNSDSNHMTRMTHHLFVCVFDDFVHYSSRSHFLFWPFLALFRPRSPSLFCIWELGHTQHVETKYYLYIFHRTYYAILYRFVKDHQYKLVGNINDVTLWNSMYTKSFVIDVEERKNFLCH